jgi:hypothetical protein
MLEKLVMSIPLAVFLAAVTIASSSTPAGAALGKEPTCGGRVVRREQAASLASRPRARRPVAMVPGLKYDPRTMTPRGICRAGPVAPAV